MPGEQEANNLKAMLRFLCANEVPKAVFRAKCGRPAPANPTRLIVDVFGLDQSSLQGWYANSMPDDRIDRLAEWYQFTPPIRTLFASGARALARHKAFETAYLGHWKPKTDTGDLPTVDHDRLTLASLSLFLNQAGPGESMPVSVELVCQPEPVASFAIAVHRGRLEVVPGVASIDQEAPPLASDEPLQLSRHDRMLTLKRENATRNDGRVAWAVSSDNGPIGVLRLDDDQVLCRVVEAAGSDVVAALFHAYVKDLDLSEPDPDDDVDDRKVSHSFLRPDGKPLSPAKRQIIKRLIVREELGISANGWHTLAEDRKKLIRNSNDG